jgi:hypothetical protein
VGDGRGTGQPVCNGGGDVSQVHWSGSNINNHLLPAIPYLCPQSPANPAELTAGRASATPGVRPAMHKSSPGQHQGQPREHRLGARKRVRPGVMTWAGRAARGAHSTCTGVRLLRPSCSYDTHRTLWQRMQVGSAHTRRCICIHERMCMLTHPNGAYLFQLQPRVPKLQDAQPQRLVHALGPLLGVKGLGLQVHSKGAARPYRMCASVRSISWRARDTSRRRATTSSMPAPGTNWEAFEEV